MALGTLLAFAAVPAPAAADFHPVCEPPAAAYANVELGHNTYTGDMVYGAVVYCPSTEVTIQEVALWHVSEEGDETLLDSTFLEPCDSEVLTPCYITAEIGDVPTGTLVVNMTFDVDDPATQADPDFPAVTREGMWLWLGSGQPVQICRSVGFIPHTVGPDGVSETSDC